VNSVQGLSVVVQFGMSVTRDPNASKKVCMRRGIIPVEPLEAALSEYSIDGFVRATPHSLHSDQVIKCALPRKPVVVEKPLALTM
jgi:predicted dehydrogenase